MVLHWLVCYYILCNWSSQLFHFILFFSFFFFEFDSKKWSCRRCSHGDGLALTGLLLALVPSWSSQLFHQAVNTHLRKFTRLSEYMGSVHIAAFFLRWCNCSRKLKSVLSGMHVASCSTHLVSSQLKGVTPNLLRRHWVRADRRGRRRWKAHSSGWIRLTLKCGDYYLSR